MSAVHSQSPLRATTVISANVEGLSANKASIHPSELCKIQHCHCLCLQETHRAKDQARPKIPGMTLVAERPHNKHGSSVFVRDGLGYTTTDSDREAVEQWADSNRLSLIHNAKLPNHSTVQYGRRDTTRTSTLYIQIFRICVRSLFWIQSPAYSTATSV